MVAESLRRRQAKQAFRRANKLLNASNVPSTRLLTRATLPKISAWSAEQYIDKQMPYCSSQNFAAIKKAYSERFPPATFDGECANTLLVFLQELESDVETQALTQEMCISLLRARFKPEFYASHVKAYFIINNFKNGFLELANDLGKPLTESQQWQKVYRFRFGKKEVKKEITALRSFIVLAMNWKCNKKEVDNKILDMLIPQLHHKIAQWLAYQCENYHSLSLGHDLDERLSSSEQLDKLIDLDAQTSATSTPLFRVNATTPAHAGRGLFAVSNDSRQKDQGAACCSHQHQEHHSDQYHHAHQQLAAITADYQATYPCDLPSPAYPEQEGWNVNQVGHRNDDSASAQHYGDLPILQYSAPPNPHYNSPQNSVQQYSAPPQHTPHQGQQRNVEFITFESGRVQEANNELIATRQDTPKGLIDNATRYYARKSCRTPMYYTPYTGEHGYEIYQDRTYDPSEGPIGFAVFKRIQGGNPLLTAEMVQYFVIRCFMCGEKRCSRCVYEFDNV
jgi:hypothetical protein